MARRRPSTIPPDVKDAIEWTRAWFARLQNEEDLDFHNRLWSTKTAAEGLVVMEEYTATRFSAMAVRLAT